MLFSFSTYIFYRSIDNYGSLLSETKTYLIKNELRLNNVEQEVDEHREIIRHIITREDFNAHAERKDSEMLRQMESKFRNHTNIDYRPGDAYDLPVQSNMVDFAFANMYLHHIENPLKAIKEIYRILKPGGKLIISDLDKHEFEFLKTEQEDVWMGFNRDDISNWYTKSGFSKVSINGAEEKCSSNSSLSNQRAEISIFIAEGTK